MVRRSVLSPSDMTSADGQASRAGRPSSDREPGSQGQPDLSSLPVAGLTRRRMLAMATALAVAWLSIAFIRQVGDVTAASARADALQAANQELAAGIAGLDAELRLIQRQDYIVQQARAYRLGSPREVPFSLQKPAPSLGVNAPGSADVRIGSEERHRSPLESWLSLLFGPTP